MFSGHSQQETKPIVLRPTSAQNVLHSHQKQQIHGETLRLQRLENDQGDAESVISKKPDFRAFGKQVEKLRMANGDFKTQSSLAKSCNVQMEMIRDLEAGKLTVVPQDLIQKINRALRLFNTPNVLKLPKVQ